MATHGEIQWPPAGNFTAAYGENLMAAVTLQHTDYRRQQPAHQNEEASLAGRISQPRSRTWRDLG